MQKSILLVDDEAELRGLLSRVLNLEGYDVHTAENLTSTKTLLAAEDYPVVILDVYLPDGSGLEFMKNVKSVLPNSEIIILTAYGTIEDGVRAIKDGAFDYIVKGDEDNRIVPIVNRAYEKALMNIQLEQLKKRTTGKYNFDNITGSSPQIKKAIEIAKKVAETDTPVLLQGETGTGKELFAQSIHNSSPRRNNSFVAINCSAIPRDLLESELFGYKAGAFTGAVRNKKGLFEEANEGTLFLDEIGDLELNLQAKLLRVIETNSFIKAGETKTTQVDVRIIAASNRQLAKEVENSTFRADLFYRLSTFTIEIPSLRDRKEDIPKLVEFFVKYYSMKMNRTINNVTPGFIERLKKYSFPGNIRELRNIIERGVILSENFTLSEASLPHDLRNGIASPVSDKLEDIEREHILKVLNRTGGNKSRTADILGIGLTTLYRKLQSYGIE